MQISSYCLKDEQKLDFTLLILFLNNGVTERKQISLALIHVCALIDLGLTRYIEHV